MASEENISKRPQFGNRLLKDCRDVFQHNACWTIFPLEKKIGKRTFRCYLNEGICQRPPGGARLLIDESKVFEYNNWDNVEWDTEQENDARNKVQKNSQTKVSDELQEKYDREADRYWDKFYNQHQNRFFKDRHWLFTEFPELASPNADTSATPLRVVNEPMNNEEPSDISCPTSSSSDVTTTVTDSSSQLLLATEKPPSNITDSSSTQMSEEAAVTPDSTSEVHSSNRPDNPVHTHPEVEKDVSVQDGVSAVCPEDYPGHHALIRMLEVGCGVGNTVFPVMRTNNDPGLFMYCCDLSSTAVNLVKEHSDYRPNRCHAFVCDVADPESPVPFPDGSLDIVILIFVLSAIHPQKMQQAIDRLARLLKPGGRIVFRDYGRYDLAQLRFKNGQCLTDNCYVRGDGTRVYFFTQEELRDMFSKAGLVEEQNLIDRRLQVNRGRQLKMYRVWLQCKYSKPKLKYAKLQSDA